MRISKFRELVETAIKNHSRFCPDPPIVVATAKPDAKIPDFYHGCPVYVRGGRDKLIVAFNAHQIKTALKYHDERLGIWWLEE